jgi:hypothetical protein
MKFILNSRPVEGMDVAYDEDGFQREYSQSETAFAPEAVIGRVSCLTPGQRDGVVSNP